MSLPITLPTPPTPPKPPAVRLDSVNTLINQTWQWFSRHAGKLLGITAVIIVAQILQVAAATQISGLEFDMASVITVIVAVFIFVILTIWTTAALYYFIIQDNESIGVWSAYRRSSTMFFPFFGTTLLVGLITFGGFILLFVPGVYWGLLYSLAPLIVLAEGPKVSALTRSKFLIKGNWWAAFYRCIVFGLLLISLSLLISFFFSSFFGILGAFYKPFADLSSFGQYFATILTTPLNAVFTYKLYQSLRRVKGEN